MSGGHLCEAEAPTEPVGNRPRRQVRIDRKAPAVYKKGYGKRFQFYKAIFRYQKIDFRAVWPPSVDLMSVMWYNKGDCSMFLMVRDVKPAMICKMRIKTGTSHSALQLRI